MNTVTAGVVVEAIHLMAGGSLDDMRRVYHPEATNREALSEPPAARGAGPEAFHATALWLRSAYSEISFEIEQAIAQDDLVVTFGTMSGRHTGDFTVYSADGGIERVFVPTGKSFTVKHAHFARLRDGLVIEHWAVRDDQGQAMQLGWIPPTPLYLLRCALATSRARRRR